MSFRYAGLKIVNEPESRQDWDAVMRELPLLADWIQRTFAVDVTELLGSDTTIVSTDEPEGLDARKFWVKTSSPPGLGVPFSGTYHILYPFPPNVPLLWTGGSDSLPSYLAPLTADELSDYGLENPESEEVFYAILRP